MIDRAKAIKGLSELEGFLFKRYGEVSSDETHIWYDRFLAVSDAISLLKEQEAVKQKAGEWIYCEDESGQDGYKCSECGFFEPWYYDFKNHNFITNYAYCPSCGKPMQEGR